MRYSIYTLTFFLIISGHLIIAQNKIDSLKALLKTDLTDTTRAISLNKLSILYFYVNPDSSLQMALQLKELSHRINYKMGEADALNLIASHYLSRGKKDSVNIIYEQAINLYHQAGNTQREAMVLNNLGLLYQNQELHVKALPSFQQCLNLRLLKEDSTEVISTLLAIGATHWAQKDSELALKYYQIGLNLSRKKEDMVQVATSLVYIGNLQMNTGDTIKALDAHLESITLFDSLKQFCRTLEPLSGAGIVFKQMGKLEKSIKYFQLLHDRSIACKRPELTSAALFQKGLVNKLLGDMNQAEFLMKKSYDIAKKYDFKNRISIATSGLYSLYKEKGQITKAFNYLEEYQALKEELFNAELTRELTTMELDFKFQKERDSIEAQKQRELLVLNTEVEKQQLYKIIYLIGFLVAIGFVFTFYKNFRLKKKAIELLQSKNDLQAEKIQLEESTRKQLEEENEKKTRSLTSTSILLLNYNERLTETINELNAKKHLKEDSTIRKVTNNLQDMKNAEDSWERIKVHFENVHPDFFNYLEKHYPQVSPNEYRLLAFIKMKLSNKEIAQMSNVTIGAVEQSKRRLKRKLGMPQNERNILAYIFESNNTKSHS